MATEPVPHEVSDRGLIYMPEIEVDHLAVVRVFESSAVGHACIWLKVQDPLAPGEVCVSVSLAEARRLAENIEWLVAHHRMAEEG